MTRLGMELRSSSS